MFSTLGGAARNHIGRLNADGSLDTSFDPGAELSGMYGGIVNAVALQADGKVIVGGYFYVAGTEKFHIARFDSTGNLDTSFIPFTDDFGEIETVVVQADGKILVGGHFDELNGQVRHHLGRLNSDGTLDTSFDPAPDGDVYNIALQADGKILVAGGFDTLCGVAREMLGRLNANGTLDTAFSPIVVGSVIDALAVQMDGKILVGGYYDFLNGEERHYLGRLNPDGSLDDSFDVEPDGEVWALGLQMDGKPLIGGGFGVLGGETRYTLGRLSPSSATVQELSASSNGTTLTWTRSGSGPEVWRVTFESSTDGVNYTPFGSAVRISGGWQLTGLALPFDQNIFIRARGFYLSDNSGSVIEMVQNIYLPEPGNTEIYLPLVIR